MVTILPTKTNLGSQLGQALGQGLQSGLQQGTQWGMSNAALDQLQQQAAMPGQTPQSILFSLIKASQYSPAIGKSLGTLYQSLLAQRPSSVSQGIDEIMGKGNVVPAQAQPEKSTKQNAFVGQPESPASEPPIKAEGIEASFPGGQPGRFSQYLPYELGKLITPDQRRQILEKARRNNEDVGFAADLMDKYNAGLITATDLANANIDKQHAQFQRQKELENDIRKELELQLPEEVLQSNRNLYYNMVAEEVPKHKDFTSAYQAVSKRIADFEKLEQSWTSKIPEAGIYGLTESQQKQLRNSAKPILKTDPLAYNILESAMVEAGNSIVDASMTLKPLPNATRAMLRNTKDYREALYPTGFKEAIKGFFTGGQSETQTLRNIEEIQQQQMKQIPEIAEKLSKQWGPEISLINIYAELSRLGWFPEQIGELFNKLSNGFSSQQQTEFAQLNKHPKIPARLLLE